ncbi:M10 family metallopeptidase C-terminal domain-containing protein [Rhizobium sp. LjRoot254]|uniref:M10 family metallopeptidase C-terminal domain-containing protein n=1 Tax=Rhizobium sp. LjRoot254 TaxID=3342297 RepID=UPI003ECF63DA
MSSNATAGDETRVNTYTTSYQALPSLAALADGGWIATWYSSGQDGEGGGIYQQRYDADGTMVGVETAVNTFTTGEQGLPEVTALSDGGWLVAWTSYDGQDGDGSGIYQQRYHADGSVFGGEMKVNTYTTNTQEFAQTAAFADGGWIVTWSSDGQDGDNKGIYQRRYNAAGETVGTETQVNSITTGIQEQQAVAVLADGGWIVTWHSLDQPEQGHNVIQQRYNAAGETVETDALVNTTTAGLQGEPSVAALVDGGWVVAWRSDGQDGSGAGIYLQRYGADGATVGVETQVNTYTTGEQEGPSIAALADGGWVVTWDSDGQDGSETGVYQQRYDADGAAAGTETLVNLFTTDYQFSRGLTAHDDGSWVVSWTSEDQDGSNRGVYQRHYAPDRIGTVDAETLSGTNWSETISGEDGDDTLKGLNGGDIIDGGIGRDRMTGGKGADTFLFLTDETGKTKARADIILDMTHADQIDLHLIDARETPDNDQAFKFINTRAFTGHEGELRYEKLKSDTYIYGDTDGDKRADFAIHLDDAMKLTAGDFAL